MVEKTITVYHGTSFDVIGGAVLSGKQPLIGKRLRSDPAWSGTLTDDKAHAIRWASRRGSDPIVLTYDLPVQIAVDEGLIGMSRTSRGFVTSIELAVNQLPRTYIQALIQFNNLSMDIINMMVRKGELSFHEVPFQYLTNQEDA